MGQKIFVGKPSKGLENYYVPFAIDNDAFPTLINAYNWRGRIKRKRGTSFLARLQRTLVSQSLGNTNGSGAFAGNIFNLLSISTSQPNAALVPSSITITVAGQTFTDDGAGNLSNGGAGTGTVIYATGAIAFQTAPVLAATAVTITFTYYPDLPVMGIEDLKLDQSANTLNLCFDTLYAYNLPITTPYTPYSVSWYKNPISGTINGATYTQKTTATAVKWNGQDYQQFWSTNYQGAFWATNGIPEPFSVTNLGMQYKAITTVDNITAGPPAQARLHITGHGLVRGDWVFVNEVQTTTGINFQTGFVISADPQNANFVDVSFPYATIATNGTGGIAQYLTSNSDDTKDCLRWYDGDPTSGSNHQPPTPPTGSGWVNFCPPLESASYSLSDLPAAQYYLIGARMIVPFKDRLLFLGPVVQTSSAGSQVYLPDTIIYSQNGVPYYTASFPGAPSGSQSYTALLTPGWTSPSAVGMQTAQPSSFWEDQAGFGGFLQAGISSAITTAISNEDVILVGFKDRETRLVYTGNDIIPFNFFTINAELGSEATFSGISLDRGAITVGGRGIVLTTQVSSQRIDLQIPDNVFQIELTGNGAQRICSYRDYINEWIVFTYKSNESSATYPNQSLFYNYREASWAIFNETYTTYGTFRPSTGYTWATIGSKFPTWSVWNEPWNAGNSTLLQPQVIGGNSQGFLMQLGEGTGEGNSSYIKSISGSTITSPGHSLNDGDYIVISGAIGTISSEINGNIFQISTIDSSGNYTPNSFVLNPPISSGTYLGGGLFKRMYIPYIQTRQFPVGWEMARKTRLGPQQYLFSTTPNAQITLLIFLSQNGGDSYNDPYENNDSLVYSSVLYTCPELTNLGLTPANINLQMPTASQQNQIWHRMNTGLLGDTVQIGFTLSDAQMTSPLSASPESITGITQSNPCVLTCGGQFDPGTILLISGVTGMTELNNKNYSVLSSTDTTITINVDSTSFTSYSSGGTASLVPQNNQFAEIELHAFILDVNPSQIIA